jgi:hypothetical protein
MGEEEMDESRGEPEIHAVPVSLDPAKTEGFALLPEEEDDSAPAAVSVSEVEAAVAFLRGQREAAINARSFEHAGRLGEMEAAVSGLLAWFRANGGA